MIKSILLHLGMNLWEDNQPDDPIFQERTGMRDRVYHPQLQFDEGVWQRALKRFAGAGGNMVVIDVADGIKYRSRPELGVADAWSGAKLRDELKRCRDLGLEPIPKLNFSACHDTWLGVYSRMLSTPQYYDCCRDVIREVVELFDGPRFLHIGMDEETFSHQRYYDYVVVRQGQLWWDDLNFYIETARGAGCRSWMWSDVLWHRDAELFRKNVPMDVVQSNWYYGDIFDIDKLPDAGKAYVATYLKLSEMGYDQVPAGSNWSCDTNYGGTVEFCREHLTNDPHLLGFMTAPWRTTEKHNEEKLNGAIDQVKAAHA